MADHFTKRQINWKCNQKSRTKQTPKHHRNTSNAIPRVRDKNHSRNTQHQTNEAGVQRTQPNIQNTRQSRKVQKQSNKHNNDLLFKTQTNHKNETKDKPHNVNKKTVGIL